MLAKCCGSRPDQWKRRQNVPEIRWIPGDNPLEPRGESRDQHVRYGSFWDLELAAALLMTMSESMRQLGVRRVP